jgi:hypothetical protein
LQKSLLGTNRALGTVPAKITGKNHWVTQARGSLKKNIYHGCSILFHLQGNADAAFETAIARNRIATP